jgi:N-sulfoglucosamine sulfohydrolase
MIGVMIAIWLAFLAATLAQDRTNILLFTADDLHAESLGVYGGQPADLTPNLDRFAAQGMQFQRAHVNVAICAPCRAVIATGQLSHRSGALGFFKAKPGTPDMVTTLQQGGYLTGILGKLDHSTPTVAMKWDYAFDRPDLGDGRNPDVYHQRTVAFLERAKKESKPFYLMVNSHDPHRPYCNPDKLRKGAAMPSKVYRPEDVKVPGFLPDLPGVRAEMSHYLNSTRRLDDTFGKVLEALEGYGFADNTVVIFLSDNGIAVPFAKCNAWYHSSRTPFLVRWPKVIPAKSMNDREFVSVVDLFPTFMELTGLTGPEQLDGGSLVPLLKGGRDASRDHVFTQIDQKAGNDAVPMRAVQTADFAYLYNPFSDGQHRYRNNNEGLSMKAMDEAAKTDPAIAARIQLFRYRVPEEFYDLRNDPNGLINLIDRESHQPTISKMRKQLQEWMRNTGDPMLEALEHRDDRTVVDAAMLRAYGPPKAKKRKQAKKK